MRYKELFELLNVKPTVEWKRQFEDRENEFFNEAILQKCDEILDDYISSLDKIKNLNEKKIMECVEKIVRKFNYLNETNDYFIETNERELLMDFITKAAKIVGLKINDYDDITYEWRKW